LYDRIKPQLAVAGFTKCGIYPFDPTVIAADKLAPAASFDRELQSPDPGQSTSGNLQSPDPGLSSSDNVQSPAPGQSTSGGRSAIKPTSQAHVMSAKMSHETGTPVNGTGCSKRSPSTPRTAMRQAVLAQLKVCNAAVRQKTARRRIAKTFGGECLTEEESVKRLNEATELKKAKPKPKRVLPVKVNVQKMKKSKFTLNPSGHKLSRKESSSEQDVELDDVSLSDCNNNPSGTKPALQPGTCAVMGLQVGDFVKVQYDSEFYPAEITAINEDLGLLQCNCMAASKIGWRWPEKRDELWYQVTDVIKKLGQPIPVTSRGVYVFADF
jgi:hypothetical protein